MTAKEYLSQAWKLQLRIESMSEVLAFMKSVSIYNSPQMTDTPKSPNRNIRKNEDTIVRMLDFEERIKLERNKLNEVLTVIGNIKDPSAQAVIVKRYIERKTWGDISRETHVSLRQVHRLHECVVDELEERKKDGTL